MKKEFQGYHPLTESEIQELLRVATLSLDANIMLNFFRFEKIHRDIIFRILSNESINKRLFVPHHAALEFYENLDEVSGEPFTKVDDIVRVIKSFKKENFGLTETIKESSIYSDLYKNISNDLDRIVKVVALEKKKIQKSFDRKSILSQLEIMLDDKVGPPLPNEEVDVLIETCILRQENKIPPGYGKDANKPGAYSFSGIPLPKKCGDYFIWEQMIREGAKHKKPIIFITDDEKPDWIKKTMQGPIPRPELRMEFKNITGTS